MNKLLLLIPLTALLFIIPNISDVQAVTFPDGIPQIVQYVSGNGDDTYEFQNTGSTDIYMFEGPAVPTDNTSLLGNRLLPGATVNILRVAGQLISARVQELFPGLRNVGIIIQNNTTVVVP